MTLLLADSFEGYIDRWDLEAGPWYTANGTLDASIKRDGSQSFLIDNSPENLTFDNITDHTGRVYISFWMYWNNWISTYPEGQPILHAYSSSVSLYGLKLTFDQGFLGWSNEDGPLVKGEVFVPKETWTHISVCVRLNHTISANDVRCQVNGVTDPAMTLAAGANTAYGSGSTYENIDGIQFRHSAGWDMYLDNLLIWDDNGAGQFSDAFIGMTRIQRLKPNGNGTTSDWTGSDADSTDNYLHVDEDVSDEDTSYIESQTVTDVDLHSYPAMSPTPDTIQGVQTVTFAKKDDVDARGIKPIARVNGSNYQGSEVLLTNGAYERTANMWEDNPDDSADWEEADVNGAEFGVEVTT